ncbi:Ig-like domain-containing protein [Cyanobium sp. CH-040]|uniref:Ig-like domain-containing protein n=1 Tax=Cyanobium sp. CH-040 TaxID=2823708 RepID=UPI0020CEA082|nr:Ig-like domain-containing protein [Cyanobium sp. CH-040]MCP9926612.1 hypothetical protein [Cyanobium sp. CH-040]
MTLALTTDCLRSIRFIIPGDGRSPDIEIYAYEGEGSDTGKIFFEATVLGNRGLTGDLRGLFFDFGSSLDGLSVEGTDITDFGTGNVIDLGNGANMRGGGRSPFDIGIEFGGPGIGRGDDIQFTSFILSGETPLSLDDIAQVQFGARVTSTGAIGGRRNGSAKLTTLAPAAPDANDDTYSIFEDGAAGLDDPRASAQGILLEVLANDTDADGDTLTIHGFERLPQWGTVEIVDGSDADSEPGDAILYTPFTDSPTLDPLTLGDSFVYCIKDNNGGTDFATVTIAPITPVADVPLVEWELLPVEVNGKVDVSQINIRVTATQTDDDESEFIDRILASIPGGLPEGATITPGQFSSTDQPLTFTKDFLLTLDPVRDYDFDITFDAWSEEKLNGDQQIGSSAPVEIVFDHNSIVEQLKFEANDQSIWSDGDAFKFESDEFLGGSFAGIPAGFRSTRSVDAGELGSLSLTAGLDYNFTAGFQSKLTFEGGSIDASATQDITVETGYNRTLDFLKIQTSRELVDAAFTTQGPRGSYDLDFIYDIIFSSFLQLVVDVPLGDLGGDVNETFPLGGLNTGKQSAEILSLDSEDLDFDIKVPEFLGPGFFSLSFNWPDLSISDTLPPGDEPLSGSGSDNFLGLTVDIDELITAYLNGFGSNPAGFSNPFDQRFDISFLDGLGSLKGFFETVDLDLSTFLRFIQEFSLSLDEITGQIIFENGTSQKHTIGDELIIGNASSIDTNNDGNIDFRFILDQQSRLSNKTDLGVGGDLRTKFLEAGVEFDVPGIDGDFNFGPVARRTIDFGTASTSVFNGTFDLDFEEQQFSAFA